MEQMLFKSQINEVTSQHTHNGHKKINMTEKIASQLKEAYNNKGRTAKHLIPQGASQIWLEPDQQGTERQNLPNITQEAPVTQICRNRLRDHQAVGLAPKQKLQHLQVSWIHRNAMRKRWTNIMY